MDKGDSTLVKAQWNGRKSQRGDLAWVMAGLRCPDTQSDSSARANDGARKTPFFAENSYRAGACPQRIRADGRVVWLSRLPYVFCALVGAGSKIPLTWPRLVD